MVVTIDLTWIATLGPYFLLGFGLGLAFYYMFYDRNSPTELERKKHDLEVRKEWLRMLAQQRKNKCHAHNV
jgi:hypothetical protein